MGRSPKRVLVWGPRRDARPAGERRSGGALEGYPKRKRGDPTWSAARDDAYAQKERLGGEPYRLSPSGDSAPPKATTDYPRRVGVLTKPCKRREEINAIVSAGNPSGSFHSPPPFAQGRLSPPGDYQPGPKILLLLFSQKSSAAPVCGGRKKRKGAPGVVPEASFPDQLGRGFMLLSVRGTGKFTRKAKAGPSAPAPFWRIWGCGWCS